MNSKSTTECQVEWEETRSYTDPDFEPQKIRALAKEGKWHFWQKGVWDTCWCALEATDAHINRACSEVLATIRREGNA